MLLDAIATKAESLRALGVVPPYTRDPKDDKFVACALAGNTSHIITTDADLLAVTSLERVRTVTPETFLRDLST